MKYSGLRDFQNTVKNRILLESDGSASAVDIVDFSNDRYQIFPGFTDVHVHLREPGFSYKETIFSGTSAAARGGYTAVCSMPNLSPVPDSIENLRVQLDIIERDAVIDVYPYASITVGQSGKLLSDMKALSKNAVAFSDDGKGVQDPEIMYKAMIEAKKLNKLIVAHCEDNSLLNGGYINAGEYAKAHSHKGISSESEYRMIERDIKLCEQTGCAYHICHISTKESVDLIRKAKKAKLNITCETAPHYLLLDDSVLQEDGRFKMNPPLRSKQDRLSLIEGIKDSTIDMIATDHAPHSYEEKSKGLKDSLMGVVGLETAFPLLYTYLVKTGIITIEKLIELMCINPRNRFSIPFSTNDYSVWDTKEEYTVDSSEFLSKGSSTPFDGYKVFGRCIMTVKNGKVVYRYEK